ncbi:MFS transporter [Actinomadura madurae]|uniref:MFS transporter n=1 Tax=Actinomadura madurae TaxID=1993 RepID=UPI0020D20AD9|nr:MFS transporter [Actinomadura madurae]
MFVRRQRRLPHPLLDLSMFGDRTFSSALGLFFVTAMVGTGTLLLVTLYLQNVTGLTPLKAGLLLLVPNVLMIIGNLVTPSLANRVRPAYLIAGGLLVAGVGYTLFVLADSTSGPETVFIAMCVVMLGTAPLAALCNHLAMGAVPADKAGSGASIVQTTTEFGLGLGIATLGTLGTAVYRGGVEDALGTLPPHVADAARESVDRAVGAAGRAARRAERGPAGRGPRRVHVRCACGRPGQCRHLRRPRRPRRVGVQARAERVRRR